MTYRFIGHVARFEGPNYDVSAETFGQKIEFPTEAAAKSHIVQGAALLSNQDFNAIGFTKDELTKYRTTSLQDTIAPSDDVNDYNDFIQKRDKAWQELVEVRTRTISELAVSQAPQVIQDHQT